MGTLERDPMSSLVEDTVEVEDSETVAATVTELVKAVTATQVDTDGDGKSFVTQSPDWWITGRTFGGMVVAQALNAAFQTVSDSLELHSLHGYFLRPIPSGSSSTHRVSELRDGRSFSLREVSSSVDGRESFRMTCSFHAPEPGDEYQLPMAPGIPGPSEVSATEAPFPFDVREIGPTERRDDGSYLSTRRCWFRTRETLPDDPAIHACLLAYFSDMTAASFRPASMNGWGTHTDASLDHAVWFHRRWRADSWSFFDLHALVNSGGRATIRATMHGDDGQLHLSMAQELLIRRLEVPLVLERPHWLDSTSDPAHVQNNEEGTDLP
jgi:acyl-CoA thioesterase-2